MIKRTLLAAGLFAALLPAVHAADFDQWPTKYTFDNGLEVAGLLNFAYDLNDFSGDRGYGTPSTTLHDDNGMRRREVGISLKKKDVFDFTANMDFQTDTWADVTLRLETKAMFGADYGRIRLGYFKTPVGFEANTASRAMSLQELSAVSQAIFEGRRTGVEWSFARPTYGASAAYFFGHDLEGDNPGTTAAGRAYWLPVKSASRMLHLGLSGSVENPHGDTDGRDVWNGPAMRVRARPEAGLTAVRLVDSGKLGEVDDIVRGGLEALWINGPWSAQAEYLHATAHRDGALSDYAAHGYYVTGSWVLTGESRPYSNGNVGNIQPTNPYGAVELLARFGDLDLDDGAIRGGRQRDLTFGANWYLTSHFKFQANYVHVLNEKHGLSSATDAVELRAQVHF